MSVFYCLNIQYFRELVLKFSYYRSFALITELEAIEQISDPVLQAQAWCKWRQNALKFLKMTLEAKAQGDQLLESDRPPFQNLPKIHLITSQN
mgnify:CR=1 FL=1